MYIPPFNNNNKPIVDVDDSTVPLNYFNIVKLKKDQTFSYQVGGYETCIVPATGCITVDIDSQTFPNVGKRGVNVWDGEPEGVYVPTAAKTVISCISDSAEIFIAGAKYATTLEAFDVRRDAIDLVQYGSDETKTHRKIKHILGQKHHDRVGRLLVSELFTVGCGGWSGFPPHKHDTDRLPLETRHDETYNFRFKPQQGTGLQLIQGANESIGQAFHLVDGATVCLKNGYHPCVVMPGYQMYYFTILGGLSQRSLVQYFQPEHAQQVETIPGIKDMIAKFK